MPVVERETGIRCAPELQREALRCYACLVAWTLRVSASGDRFLPTAAPQFPKSWWFPRACGCNDPWRGVVQDHGGVRATLLREEQNRQRELVSPPFHEPYRAGR